MHRRDILRPVVVRLTVHAIEDMSDLVFQLYLKDLERVIEELDIEHHIDSVDDNGRHEGEQLEHQLTEEQLLGTRRHSFDNAILSFNCQRQSIGHNTKQEVAKAGGAVNHSRRRRGDTRCVRQDEQHMPGTTGGQLARPT